VCSEDSERVCTTLNTTKRKLQPYYNQLGSFEIYLTLTRGGTYGQIDQ